MQKSLSDQDTLALLHPSEVLYPRFALFKNRLRLQGSLQMNLKKPSRYPEFSRPYIPGDPLNRIDWKAYARTDQLLLRENRDEASAHILILLEESPTLHWPLTEHLTLKNLPPTKWEIALRVACHLASSHLGVGDQVTFVLGRSRGWDNSPFSILRSVSEMHGVFEEWQSTGFPFGGLDKYFANREASLKGAALEGRAYDCCYFVSDALSEVWDAYGKKPHFTHRFLVLCHILSSLETNPQWMEPSQLYFDDPLLSGGILSKEYFGDQLLGQNSLLQALSVWQSQLKHQVRSLPGYYFPLTDTTTLKAYAQGLGDIAKGMAP